MVGFGHLFTNQTMNKLARARYKRRQKERALALAEANLRSANSIIRTDTARERALAKIARAKLLREIARRKKVRDSAGEYVKARLAEIELI